MNWHVDETLSNPPNVEAAFTITNDSGSFTQWALPDGEVLSERLNANSLLPVRSGGASHQVMPVTRGSRSIIEAAFSTTWSAQSTSAA